MIRKVVIGVLALTAGNVVAMGAFNNAGSVSMSYHVAVIVGATVITAVVWTVLANVFTPEGR